jgi:hypothetical protein
MRNKTDNPEHIQDMYHAWLCRMVDIKQRNKTYWLLANALHAREFEWSVPNDDNRSDEGRNLRERFCDETNIEYRLDDFPEAASMLEVIVALAIRCYDITVDEVEDMAVSDWFWVMLDNVGLKKFTDDSFYELRGQIVVDEILDMIIDRTYKRDGRGGLFPLERSRKDQRKVELWYQMNTYLVENYYNDGVVV